MTRLWIMSDLHQEHADNAWDPARHAPACDVVVVAGDVHTPGDRAIDWLADRLVGVPVVYVAGNHDFWIPRGADPHTLQDMRLRMRDRASARGIHLLDDSAVEIAGVRFVGGALWTDQRLGADNRGHAWSTARRQMYDYRRIRRRRTGRHHNIRVEDTVALHRETREVIEAWLRAKHAGPTVVVTHHAPAPWSLSDPDMDLRWCYASDLSSLMTDLQTHPDLWVHGHVHARSDYVVGGTRVVANPRGHVEETSGFVPDFVVTV